MFEVIEDEVHFFSTFSEQMYLEILFYFLKNCGESYAQEVGFSSNPDVEDDSSWGKELTGVSHFISQLRGGTLNVSLFPTPLVAVRHPRREVNHHALSVFDNFRKPSNNIHTSEVPLSARLS